LGCRSLRTKSRMTRWWNENMNRLQVGTRVEWREWLAHHHASGTEVWLVYHKKGTGIRSISYDASVE